MFSNKKTEDTNAAATDFNWVIDDQCPLFKSVKSLVYEAESQFKANQLELCDDILAVVVRHIKRNKFVKKELIAREDLINLKEE